MTDRELLEAAAKAAGYQQVEYSPTRRHHFGPCLLIGPRKSFMEDPDREEWNPLTDDGDRYRLARTLGLVIDFDGYEVRFYSPGDGVPRRFSWTSGDKASEALAIVRAAAAMAGQEQ